MPEPGNEDSRGPVGRVFDLVASRTYAELHDAPLASAVEKELRQAFFPRPGDPHFKVADVDALNVFL